MAAKAVGFILLAAILPACSPAGHDYQSCFQHHGSRAKADLAVGMASTACGYLHGDQASPGQREWARCVLRRIDQPGSKNAASMLYRDCSDTPTQRAEGEEAERRRRSESSTCYSQTPDPSLPEGYRRVVPCPPPSSRFEAVMERVEQLERLRQ